MEMGLCVGRTGREREVFGEESSFGRRCIVSTCEGEKLTSNEYTTLIYRTVRSFDFDFEFFNEMDLEVDRRQAGTAMRVSTAATAEGAEEPNGEHVSSSW